MTRERKNKLDFLNIKKFFSVKKSQENEKTSQTGRKCLQKTPLKKDCYPKYTKNFKNSTIGKQLDFKMGKRLEQTPHRRRYIDDK